MESCQLVGQSYPLLLYHIAGNFSMGLFFTVIVVPKRENCSLKFCQLACYSRQDTSIFEN